MMGVGGKRPSSTQQQRRVGRKAFTLIELLVAVSIFSGVVILTLGAFARSADSSIRSSAVRERTKEARTVVDRIGNDTRYLYTKETFNAGASECTTTPKTALGYMFSNGCLAMLLQYPGSADDELVFHRYARVITGNRESVHLEEANACQITGGNIVCSDPDRSSSTFNDIMSLGFSIVDETDPYYSSKQLFSGITPFDAQAQNVSPILTVRVVIKPTNITNDCDVAKNECYTIESSFVPGG